MNVWVYYYVRNYPHCVSVPPIMKGPLKRRIVGGRSTVLFAWPPRGMHHRVHSAPAATQYARTNHPLDYSALQHGTMFTDSHTQVTSTAQEVPAR